MYPVEHVTLETTAFCNLNCSFCPINKLRRNSFIMDFRLVQKIIKENPQLTRINLNNWGEPLLHKRLFEIIGNINAQLPDCDVYFATNGRLLNDKRIDALLSLKIREIQFSVDAVGLTYETIRGCDYATTRVLIEHLLERRTGHEPKISIKAVINSGTEMVLEELLKEWLDKVDDIKLQPMMLPKPRKVACPEPFDNHPVVLSDGRVVPCCADYNGQLTVGDAAKDKLIDIWNNEKMENLRTQHNTKQFELPCSLCGEYETDLCKRRFG